MYKIEVKRSLGDNEQWSYLAMYSDFLAAVERAKRHAKDDHDFGWGRVATRIVKVK